MNKLLLFCCLLISNFGMAQWRTTTPLATNIFDVTFTDDYTGYAVCQGGPIGQCSYTLSLFKTVDKGETWVRLETGTTGQVKAVHFANQLVGWTAGSSSEIRKTTDGGVTWTQASYGVGSGYNDIWFKDVNNGFVLGNNGMLRKSTNGGTSWTTITSGVTASLKRIYFQNSNIGFIACSDGQMLRTTNGGNTWTATNIGATWLSDVYFIGSTGYALGTNSGVRYLYKTTDSGLNWTAISLGSILASKVFFPSASVGYLISDGNGIMKTTDGGATWSVTPTMNGLYDTWYGIYFTDELTGYICGGLGRINKTTDGGLTWKSKTAAFSDDLTTVATPHKDTAYFGDIDGKLFRTTNGGVTYVQQAPDQPADITKVYFTSGTTGFASSDNGVILKTDDAGENWIQKPTNSSHRITDLSFVSPQIGFASSYGGVVFKTVDNGETWDSITTGFPYDYYDIWFNNVDTGYVTTSDKIIRTFDGGLTWIEYDPNVTGSFKDIVFTSNTLGYCGGFGKILMTTDAGLTWNLRNTAGGYLINEMWFANDSLGYFTYNSSQRKTIDSCGAIYSQSTACLANNAGMNGISMTDGGQYGYAVGGLNGLVHQLETPEIIETQVSTNNYCPNDIVFVAFLGKGFYSSGNVYTAQLSDAAGSFASPTTIGSVTLQYYGAYQSGVITATIPSGTPAGSNYRIRVVASAPNYVAPDNGFDITIQAGQTPTVSLSSASIGAVCPGSSLVLNASITGGGLSPEFQWSVNGSPIDYHAATLITDTLSDGDLVQVTLVSSLGCASPSSVVSNTFTVDLSDPIVIGLPNDTTACENSTVQLNAIPGNTYDWTPLTGLDNYTIDNPIATVTQDITYHLLVTNIDGCTATDSILVQSIELPEILTNDTSACENSSVQLNATTGGTYAWSPTLGLSAANTADPIATITQDVTYFLTVTSLEGCVATDSVVVLSLDLPELLTNDTTACFNSDLQLSATAGGTYLWSPSMGLSATTTANPIATVTQDITYYLSVISADGCAITDSVAIQSLDLAEILTNDTVACVNAGIQLNATSGGTYSWSPSMGLSATTTENPVATITQDITYYLSATSADGCLSNDSIVLLAHPEQTITLVSDTTICEGDCFVLSPTFSGGIQSVIWSTETGLNDSTVLNPTACPVADIAYNLTITDNNSCAAFDTITVVVNALPTVPIITFDGTTLTATTAFSYQWFLDGNAIAGATSSTYVPTQNGDYSVEVTNAAGCSALSAIMNLNSIGFGEMVVSQTVFAYPNPVQDKLWLRFSEGQFGTAKLIVVDLAGKIVLQQNVTPKKAGESIEINVADLANGMYHCSIVTNDGVQVIEFVKTK